MIDTIMTNIKQKPRAHGCPPVLIIIFNRPILAGKVISHIRRAKPAQMFVAADGPRDNVANEQSLCQRTRAEVLGQVDWHCEIKTLFQEKNLGCGLGPATAITWFFENVEEGIVLEDDCLPSDCFFPFCQQMLSRYRDDRRILAVSGTNILREWKKTKFDYVFSLYGGNWGWATWRRSWKLVDFEMKSWRLAESKRHVYDVLGDYQQGKGVSRWFDSVSSSPDGIWDYQWFYARLMNSGLSIVPTKNMVSNIGFGADATHTTQSGPFDKLPLYNTTMPISLHPEVSPDREFDRENAKAYGFFNHPIRHAPAFIKMASYLRKLEKHCGF